ncbi:MAG: AAA family ATPase [Roseivirga sp.]
MSYEDFVEGIKPDENEGQVTYCIEDGIFKSICAKAKTLKASEADVNWNDRIFFKMSLGGKNSSHIHSWCIENNKVALGWGGEKDLSEFENCKSWEEHRDKFIAKYPSIVEESKFNIQATRSFMKMKEGSIVVASLGNHIIDAIGIIDGPYEYDDFNEFGFHHLRSVKWIAKDLNTAPERFFKKNISQQTIYEFYSKDIKFDAFEELTASGDTVPKPHVLIIDEINRGNVSSIFGELITLLEEDKRKGNMEELELVLPYSKSKFSVPNNVYIIGTMNTADRSVEALDTALRRRFSFTEMAPNCDLLKPNRLLWSLWLKDWNYKWDDPIWLKHETDLLNLLGGTIQDKKAYRSLEDLPWSEGFIRNVFNGIVEFDGFDLSLLLQTINIRIEKLIDKNHMIGHSYFLSVGSLDGLKDAFQNKIIPLLQEYFFGDYGKIGLVLGEGFFEPLDENINDVFAKFRDYDVNDLTERPVYHLRDVQLMEDEEFTTAMNLLLA